MRNPTAQRLHLSLRILEPCSKNCYTFFFNGNGCIVNAPSDAIVLFDGKDLSKWKSSLPDGKVQWTVADGAMTVKPGSKDIETIQQFDDYQLHIEFRTPAEVQGTSQGRGNSGIFMQGKYELQVLDNYDNRTYSTARQERSKTNNAIGKCLQKTGGMADL